VFGSGRRQPRTRAELFRDELGKTFDHLRQAAVHGADGFGTAMGPRMDAAKSMAKGTASGAVAQLAAARRQGMQQAADAARRAKPTMRRKKREREMARKRRGYRFAGLLAVGAALGAVGALIGRRRRQTSWEVYDNTVRPPQPPVQMSEPATKGPGPASQAPEPSPGQGTRGVGPLAEQARNALNAPGETAPETEAVSPNAQASPNRRG
jgi:hypothetical protein